MRNYELLFLEFYKIFITNRIRSVVDVIVSIIYIYIQRYVGTNK